MFKKLITEIKKKDIKSMLPFLIPAVAAIVLIVLIIVAAVKKSGGEPAVSGNDTISLDIATGGQTSVPGEAGDVIQITGEITGNTVADDGVTLQNNGNTNGEYLADCIFLGDSRYVAMYNYGYMPAESVLAKVGTNHNSAMTEKADNGYTMDDYLATHQAGVIYIGYGVNSLKSNENTFISSYKTLVDKVQAACPNSVIVICSIWPVEDDGAYKNTVSNELCNKFNALLHDMAEEKGLFYLNFDEVLKDADGTMVDKFNSGDGLHYNKGAYADIFEFIVAHPVTSYVRGTYCNTDFNYDYSNPDNRVYYSTYYSHPEEQTTTSENTASGNSVSSDTPAVSDNQPASDTGTAVTTDSGNSSTESQQTEEKKEEEKKVYLLW